MLANFFSIGDRNYLNNAVVIADALSFIYKSFGIVYDFKITFRKPFLSQGEFKIGFDKLDGHIVGQFMARERQFFFSYSPTDIELETREASANAVFSNPSTFNMCYYITDKCRGEIEKGFEKIYGPMSEKDKVIFVIFEVPDTSVFVSLLHDNLVDKIRILPAEFTGERRLRLPIFVGDTLLGYRHSTVKEFKV